MNMTDIVKLECCEVGFTARDKDDALMSLAKLLSKNSKLEDIPVEDIYSSLKQREEMGSTGFGKGIAIPHSQLEGLKDFIIGIAISVRGVNFNSLDKKRTKIFVTIIGPKCIQWQEEGKMWAQLFEQAGYETYMTGKWHVGADPAETFNVSTDIRGGMPKQTPEGYNRPVEGKPDPWDPSDKQFGGFWEGGTHWSEKLANTAVKFINQASGKKKPFFMYLAFNAAHDPRQSPVEYIEKYPLNKISLPVNYMDEYPFKDQIGCGKDLRDEKLAPFPRTPHAVKVNRREYYALITYMDEQIGRIIKALEESGEKENTYIYFTADHGLSVGHHGLIGKQNMFDHSVRVPLMVIGPDIPQNKRIETPVYLQDIMPSSLDLAGLNIPDYIQFQSLIPLINGERSENYNAIYGAYCDYQRMVTKDGFKLILYPKVPKALLFNLKNDPLEQIDLSEMPEYQEKKKILLKNLEELQKETGDTLDLKLYFPELIL